MDGYVTCNVKPYVPFFFSTIMVRRRLSSSVRVTRSDFDLSSTAYEGTRYCSEPGNMLRASSNEIACLSRAKNELGKKNELEKKYLLHEQSPVSVRGNRDIREHAATKDHSNDHAKLERETDGHHPRVRSSHRSRTCTSTPRRW